MRTERLETEARAKIFWGEPPEEVLSYLRSQGVSEQEAKEMLEAIEQERHTNVRASGRRKILMGAPLLFVPVGAYFVFLSVFGVIPVKLFCVAMAMGLYGLWQVVDGLMKVLTPARERGDLSQED